MPQKTHTMHGRDHLVTGADPIPGLFTSPVVGNYYEVILGLDDLYGYWRLGEDSGGTFVDSSAGGNDLTVYAAGSVGGSPNTYPLTRNVTGALTVGDDGACEFNIPPGDTSTQLAGEWLQAAVGSAASPATYCGWIKCKASGTTMTNGVAFGTTGFSASLNIGWGFCVDWPALTFRFVEGNWTTTGIELTSSNLIADIWYFVCVTDDETDHRLYVNAVEVDSAPTPILSAQDVIRVGWGIRGGGVTSWQPFYGMVDEVAIWSRALTLGEIQTIYAAGIGDSTGEVMVTDGAGHIMALPNGTEGQILTIVGGVPAWADA